MIDGPLVADRSRQMKDHIYTLDGLRNRCIIANVSFDEPDLRKGIEIRTKTGKKVIEDCYIVPSATNCRTRLEPIKPAPPVTRAFNELSPFCKEIFIGCHSCEIGNPKFHGDYDNSLTL